MDRYQVVNLIVLTTAIYATSYLLVKAGIVRLLTHRRAWNICLLITFLVMGILGLIMAIAIEYNINLAGYKNILWLHVEFGIAMAIIAIFHTLWHWKYFFQIFSKRK